MYRLTKITGKQTCIYRKVLIFRVTKSIMISVKNLMKRLETDKHTTVHFNKQLWGLNHWSAKRKTMPYIALRTIHTETVRKHNLKQDIKLTFLVSHFHHDGNIIFMIVVIVIFFAYDQCIRIALWPYLSFYWIKFRFSSFCNTKLTFLVSVLISNWILFHVTSV